MKNKKNIELQHVIYRRQADFKHKKAPIKGAFYYFFNLICLYLYHQTHYLKSSPSQNQLCLIARKFITALPHRPIINCLFFLGGYQKNSYNTPIIIVSGVLKEFTSGQNLPKSHSVSGCYRNKVYNASGADMIIIKIFHCQGHFYKKVAPNKKYPRLLCFGGLTLKIYTQH